MVHIKDGCWNPDAQTCTYTFPGEGQGDVRRIVEDLLRNGYDGGFSIEPHLAVVFHEDRGETREDAMRRSYVEYGHRMEKLIAEIPASRLRRAQAHNPTNAQDKDTEGAE